MDGVKGWDKGRDTRKKNCIKRRILGERKWNKEYKKKKRRRELRRFLRKGKKERNLLEEYKNLKR